MIWLVATLCVAGFLAFKMTGEDPSLFLPGGMTDGHHQIELACGACHTPFAGVRQESCLACHQAELEAAEDSHSERIFIDPRNAADLERLDVRHCVTCHTEHRPEITGAMGVTLPPDFCRHCHAGVGEERPTHRDFSFDTCASAGCHNYHDNRSLYEDFLVRHGDAETETRPAEFPRRKAWISREIARRPPMTAADFDGPASSGAGLIGDWAGSGHAASGINCSDCHQSGGSAWADRPPRQVCRSCHELEHQGFTAGRHGMRWSVDSDSMSPSGARLPMKPDSGSRTLDCGSCHDVHSVNVRHAAVEACLSCHDDDHSLAYSESAHHRLWESEMSGQGKPGSGVSCASCHLPREARRAAAGELMVVQHNQNDNLRPNEKMIRQVCLTCHSLALSIDSLADPDLIRRNFSGRPARHVRSIDMAVSRTQ